MKKIIKIFVFAVVLTFTSQAHAQSIKYKCMLQMNAYTGESAYIVVSLINPKGNYEKTLFMMGKETKWYNSLKEWFKFSGKKKKLDAKSGASVAGGDRAMMNLEIDEKTIDKGYKLRFESSVEDQKYYVNDVEVPLTSETLASKSDGKGYIKYIRFSKVQP